MNIPMPNEVQPVSFIEYANQFADFDSRKQQQRLIDMKMQQMPQEQARRDRLADANIDSMETEGMADKHKLAIQISSGIYNAMQQSGLQENDPAFQQQLEQVSRPLRPILSKVFGVPDDPSKPTDWNGIKSLAMAGQTQEKDNYLLGYDEQGRPFRFSKNHGIGGPVPSEGGGFLEGSNKTPAYNAAWTNAGKGQGDREITNSDGTKSVTTNQRLNPDAFPIQPQGQSYQLTPEELKQRALQGDPMAIAEIEKGGSGVNVLQAQPPSYGPTAEQLNEQKINLAQGEADVKTDAEIAKKKKERIQSVTNLLGLLNKPVGESKKSIESLIKESTGSSIGALVDKGSRAIGKATPGAMAIAELEPIQEWLTSLVPRMEGPQSNFDVERYKAMAGKIADPSITSEERIAAYKSLKAMLNEFLKNDGKEPETTKGPKVGTIEDGHKFKGGDPADPNNWEALP